MNENNVKIPKILFWLLDKILPGNDFIYLTANFQELHETIQSEKGRLYAILWLCGEIIKSVPGLFTAYFYWRIVMTKSYFIIAFRNFKKYKTYSF